MVKKYLFIVVCALFFSSCTKEKTIISALCIKSVSTKLETGSFITEGNRKEYDTLLWCTGNDIEWYNATTGQLKIKENTPPPTGTSYFVVFLDDIELLNFPYIPSISSLATAHPCITSEAEGLCICKGYPRWDPKDRGPGTSNWDWAALDEEREKNWKAIESEWNLFIEQLKKEGRYRE